MKRNKLIGRFEGFPPLIGVMVTVAREKTLSVERWTRCGGEGFSVHGAAAAGEQEQFLAVPSRRSKAIVRPGFGFRSVRTHHYACPAICEVA